MDSDMKALTNALSQRGGIRPPCTGFTPSGLPDAYGTHTGVSSEYVPQENHFWFVLRVVYNRVEKAYERIAEARLKVYTPLRYIRKTTDGKQKKTLVPLLPNIVFVYATRAQVAALVHYSSEHPSTMKYFLDKTRPKESNGKHPPLTITFDVMMNFIRMTSIRNEHIRVFSPEQNRCRKGDWVRVIDGDFKGVKGRVARIAGQQRVIVEMEGLCWVATAYIPTAFIERIENESDNNLIH